MPEATEGTAAPERSSATALESDLGQMFGDFTSPDESPEPDASAAGTTPVEPAAGTEKEPEGEEAPVTTEQPSEGTTPDAAPVVDEDPFKDTTPGEYIVNGKPVTVEDIRVFKEGGAVIRPEALPNIYSKLAERDQLAERVRARDTEYQTLSKATEWTDQDGKSYTGPEAAIEMRIANAGLFAENQLLVSSILQSEDLQALLTTKQVADGNGGVREVVIFRPDVIKDLQRENALQQRELTATTRDHFKGVLAEASKSAAPAIDFAAATPQLVSQIAETLKLDATALTAADRQLLADLLPDHVKNGQASLKWQKLAATMMKDRAAQKASATSLVSTTEKATKDAQARMAAAARGVKPASRPATPVAPKKPNPVVEHMADEGVLFDSMISAGAKAMRAS